MAKRFERRQRLLLWAWVAAFLGFFAYASSWPEKALEPEAKQRKGLKVYSNPKYYRELEKPAEFGLEKLASVVNYLLLAAAAVLGFTTKSLMEFRSERAKGDTVHAITQSTGAQLLLLLHADIACFFSLTWGGCAYLTLPDITLVETFTVTGTLSRYVMGQITGLLLAGFLLLQALKRAVRDLLP